MTARVPNDRRRVVRADVSRSRAPPGSMSAPADPTSPQPSARVPFGRLAPLVIIVAITAGALALGLHRGVSVGALLEHRAEIERFVSQHWVEALAGYTLLYIVVTALSLPCASFLTIFGG